MKYQSLARLRRTCRKGFAGCSDAAAPRTVVGSYALRSVDGTALPWDSGGNERLVSGTVTLRDNGAFHMEFDVVDAFNNPVGEVSVRTIDGLWTLEGATLTYTDTGPLATGSVSRRGHAPTHALADGQSRRYRIIWVAR